MNDHDAASLSSSASTPAPRSRRRLALLVGSALAAAVVVAALAGRHAVLAPAPTRDVPHLDGKSIRFSRAFAQRAGIELAAASTASLAPSVSVTGTVTFDPDRVAAIGARIDGRVRRIRKFPGDPVAAGDVLAEIESAALGTAQTGVLSARAHFEAARANELRETQLAEAKVSSQREAEVARATALVARAELHAAEQKVRALGGDVSPDIGVLALTSPIAGKVVESHVSRGQSVEPTQTLFRVADLARVWIELAVFEREVNHVRRGDEVEIIPQSNTSVVLTGKVAHVGDIIALETRSADVRVVVDNADGTLRPGQSVLAKIRTATTHGDAVVLPRDAVTSIDGRPTVFVAHDDTSVEPRVVVTGASDGTHIEIASGVAAGERVVVRGVFALKSEIFR